MMTFAQENFMGYTGIIYSFRLKMYDVLGILHILENAINIV